MTHPRPPSTSDGSSSTATTRTPIGVGTSSRWRLGYALVLLLVLASGACSALWNPALLRPPGGALLDGSVADAYQRAFDAESVLLGPARTLWGLIDTQLFGQGRTGVLIGRDGWLYSREEYTTVADPEGAIAVWVERLSLVRDALGRQGAGLVVALVPSKASMVPQYVRAPLPRASAERYDTVLDVLGERGVVVADLRPALADGEASFLRTDTHWTPEGAAAAARAIAATVREHAPYDAIGQARYETERGAVSERFGDLTGFLDLGPLLGALGPAPDRVRDRRTVSLEEPSTDLFAEVDVPVALVGTSYSADPTWNLVGALREALGSDVLDASQTGLGPWEPMERYLNGEALRSTPPKVVIWEIPERYLTLEGFVPTEARW